MNEERDAIFVIEKDNNSVLRLKQFSATKKMQRAYKCDLTPNAALENFVCSRRKKIEELESEIKIATSLVIDALTTVEPGAAPDRLQRALVSEDG